MSEGTPSAFAGTTTPANTAAANTTTDLVRAAARSDENAWKTIIDRYTGTVRSIARAHRLGDADAADVAQTVWLRLLLNIGQLRDPERVGGWVATTARHECLRLCRQQGRLRLVDDTAVLDSISAAPGPAPAVESEGQEVVLRGAVESLPPRQRAILDLLMADPPTSYGDIATGLGIPIGSIGPTRRRTLQSLRTHCRAAELLPG